MNFTHLKFEKEFLINQRIYKTKEPVYIANWLFPWLSLDQQEFDQKMSIAKNWRFEIGSVLLQNNERDFQEISNTIFRKKFFPQFCELVEKKFQLSIVLSYPECHIHGFVGPNTRLHCDLVSRSDLKYPAYRVSARATGISQCSTNCADKTSASEFRFIVESEDLYFWIDKKGKMSGVHATSWSYKWKSDELLDICFYKVVGQGDRGGLDVTYYLDLKFLDQGCLVLNFYEFDPNFNLDQLKRWFRESSAK